ncbi:MAG: hypothetical protein ACPGSL_09980 [Vicingaceae bacterium]
MGLRDIIPNISDEELSLVNRIENTREAINDAREYGDDTEGLYKRMAELKDQLEEAKMRRRIAEANKDENSVFYTGDK